MEGYIRARFGSELIVQPVSLTRRLVLSIALRMEIMQETYVLYKDVLGKVAHEKVDLEGKLVPLLSIPPILFMGDYKCDSLRKYPHVSLLIELFQMKAKVQPIDDWIIRHFMFMRPDLNDGV